MQNFKICTGQRDRIHTSQYTVNYKAPFLTYASHIRISTLNISSATLLRNPLQLHELAAKDSRERDEQTNLAYVAMTRAEQLLLVPPGFMNWVEAATRAS